MRKKVKTLVHPEENVMITDQTPHLIHHQS